MQSSRQTQQSDMQASRQAQQDQLQSNRAQQQDQNREDWQQYGTERQESRQEYGNNAREDWQEYGEDYHGGYYHGGYYGGYPAYPTGGVAAGMVIGATMTAAAFNAQKASCSTLVVNGVSYYQCGSTWYQPSYQGGNVTYIVVNPPK
jgi:hypothetical protein